jgi:hypothetical protein
MNNSPSFTNKVGNTKNAIQSGIKNTGDYLLEKGETVSTQLMNGVEKSKNAITSQVKEMPVLKNITSFFNNYSTKISNFSQSNSTISKVVFILFVFILFGLLMRLGIYIIGMFLVVNKNPMIIDGMISTNQEEVISTQSEMGGASKGVSIFRSNNEFQGIEFTWSTWINIDNVTAGKIDSPQKIFSKGRHVSKNKENQFLMEMPGVYLWNNDTKSSHDNTLTIAISTFENPEIMTYTEREDIKKLLMELIQVKNVPIQKWFNLIIRCQHKTIDIYINGILYKRVYLNSVVKQNYGDIFIGENSNGMHGNISNLQYFSSAINNNQILNIVESGPNTKLHNYEFLQKSNSYLASRWYTDELLY